MYWLLNLLFHKSILATFILSLLAVCSVSVMQMTSSRICSYGRRYGWSFPITNGGKIPSKFSPVLPIRYQDPNVVLFRPSLTYSVNPKWDLTAGYLWAPYLKTGLTENRIWQQAVYKHGIGKMNVMHQVRLEQRFLENQYETSVRGGSMMLATYPLPAQEIFCRADE